MEQELNSPHSTETSNFSDQNLSKNSNSPVGSVLVVGGGIAGMRASLDLADQGFKVYLVEKQSAIGGKMAQLDKTFPTNDCAMCNISPILVETGNHPNIEILTNTNVLDISGKRGNFSVQVQQEPRYIDHDKCVACNDCVEVCPVTIPDLFNEALISKTAIYKQYPQAIPNAYAIEKAGIAPCRAGCPAGQRAQGYIALIVQGRYREALQVIKEDNPFPSVCSRTCHHPCESKCTLNLIGDPVNIMSLKRFVVDHSLAYGRDKVEPAPRTKPEWVAIIGAGPAGLTAAHDLAKLGYGTTVFEALPVAGGMMWAGIPAHRLPKGDLQQDIDDILALGVVLKTNSPIKNPTKLLEEGYNAVCLATGISTEDHSLGLEGEDAEGVIPAATFLRKINLGEPVMIGDHVAVLGGGITALDSAAVAQRLGSESVHLVLHRPRGELPAYHWEFDAVESEGIHILERTTATRILTENGKVVGIELAKTARGSITDKHGRSRPKVKKGTEFTLDVDTVIGTVGQFSDLSFLDSDFDNLEVDLDTLASEIPGLFVVGGRKTGASFIIEAISLGHRVAKSIHSYLQGFPLDKISAPRPLVVEFSREDMIERVQSGEVILQPRIEPSLLSMEERMTSFREVMLGFTEAQARKEANRCLQCGICSECLACVIACGANAINHDMVAQERLLNVGGMILAPGYQTYRAELSEEYGYGRYLNVLTSIQLERLLSASGPTLGRVKRPSDEKIPKRIAFLQCIGSRDQDHNYCSSICCMAATKEAVIAKQHHPEIEIHVFMMDMRAYSKGYWEYFVRAQEQYGVQYHRCRISGLSENSETNNLVLQHLPEDSATFKTVKDEFDLVVLSVGMEISEDVRVLGRRLGIDLDEYGFCHNVKFNPIETSLPGIYAVGPFREPKDIPESVIEASGAAGAIGTFLNKARFTQTRTVEFPAERDIQCAPPRVGVFVCHCGSNIGGYLDVPEVTEYASTLPLVVHAEDNLYSCSQDSIKHITKIVEEENLNRVVVASCTPLTHQPLFRNSIRDAGLNPYLFEMANIRNQCSWVHSTDNLQATKKAKDLVRMAVAKVIKQTAQSTVDVPIEKTGLVVGGGAAGMTAALTLADNGFPVHLVEKDAELGGQLRNIHTQLNGKDPQFILKELLHKTGSHKNITVHLNSQVTETSGFKGNFSSQIRDEDERTESINHGVTILATGGMEYTGSEYGFGSDPRILTQQAFEGLITGQSGELIANPPKSVVMIQCIGPAEDYCSRICCTVALKNALALKEKLPDTQVSIIYKDIRVFGFNEKLYTDVRDLGVLFFRYDDDHKPEVNIKESHHPDSLPDDSTSTLTISVWDKLLQKAVKLPADLLVLSMPVIPHPEMKDLANKFKVSLDNNGFFLEAHVKLRPVDFSTEGIFMAGLAHFPKLIDESMIQAQAAASRASVLLSKDFIKAGGAIAVVEQQHCTGCLTCVRVCPFDVPVIQADILGVGNVLGAAYIEPAICQGCGICVAECPAKAIDLMHYTEDQLRSKVTALLNPESILLEVI